MDTPVSILSAHGVNLLDFDGTISWMMTKLAADERLGGNAIIDEKYYYPILEDIGNHIVNRQFTLIFDPKRATNAFTLDWISQNVYPKNQAEKIADVVDCLTGKKVPSCELKEDENPLPGNRIRENFPPSGATSIARYIFSKYLVEAINTSYEHKLSTLVFEGYLFSALHLMTAGHSGMEAVSRTAHVLLFLEFVAFVLVFLLVLPVGLKQRSNE